MYRFKNYGIFTIILVVFIEDLGAVNITDCSNSNLPQLFIQNGMLNLIPFTSKPPLAQCSCNDGTVYNWDAVNDSIPYNNFYMNNIAYIVKSNSACQLCLCTENSTCYTPMNNLSYDLNFIPFCQDHICHMYGVVYSQPDFPTYTLISTSGQIYQPPLPFLEPLSQNSSYLKISTISCSGCDSLSSQKTCSNSTQYVANYTSYLTSSLTPTFDLSQVVGIVIGFGVLAIVSVILYVLILYAILRENNLWELDIYKLIFHLGLLNITDTILRVYYVSIWGIWYGPMARQYVVAIQDAVSIAISTLTWALALNRWDVLANPVKIEWINRKWLYLVITVIAYFSGVPMFIWNVLPGWGRFMINVQINNEPHLEQIKEYMSLQIYYIQLDIEQSLMVLSLVLYIWSTMNIVYKRYVSNNISKKELLLFAQALFPCLVRIVANAITMAYTSRVPWFLLSTNLMWLLESCHYPFLYLLLNKSIRHAIKRHVFKREFSSSVVQVTTVVRLSK